MINRTPTTLCAMREVVTRHYVGIVAAAAALDMEPESFMEEVLESSIRAAMETRQDPGADPSLS